MDFLTKAGKGASPEGAKSKPLCRRESHESLSITEGILSWPTPGHGRREPGCVQRMISKCTTVRQLTNATTDFLTQTGTLIGEVATHSVIV